LILREDKIAFIIYSSDIEFSLEALDALTAGPVVAMDDFVAYSPNKFPSVPNADQELCCFVK
jgi:hypothetical protein